MSNNSPLESEESSEEWYEEGWEEVELYIACVWSEEISQKDFEEKHKLVSRSIIPREVFAAMHINEIIEYILDQGEEPRSLFYKPFLVEQAIEIQQGNLNGVFALFQLQREDELYISVKEIAMVEERETQRYLWRKRISKTPPALPFPVIECLLKHVLLLNDPRTINNVRRVSREIKIVLESEPYISIIRQQMKHRKFNDSLFLYNLSLGPSYISPFNGVAGRDDDAKLNILHEKLSKIDLQIAHKFACFHRCRNKSLALKLFHEYCVQNMDTLEKCILNSIKTL